MRDILSLGPRIMGLNLELPTMIRSCARLFLLTAIFFTTNVGTILAQDNAPKPTSHTTRRIEGWTVRIDDRLLQAPNEDVGKKALRYLENKLFDITVVVPADKVQKLQAVTIVLDLTHGKLVPMQYHP